MRYQHRHPPKSQGEYDAELKLKPKKPVIPPVEPPSYVREKPMPAYVSRRRGPDDEVTPEEIKLMKMWQEQRETKELYKYMERNNGKYEFGNRGSY